MKTLNIAILLILSAITNMLHAQQTVGLFLNSEDSYNGYTLLTPIRSTSAYLIDNCGEMVHHWECQTNPALASYLLENGVLLRTGRTNNLDFDSGGNGGQVFMIDWDGNVIWSYTVSSEMECQHHDVEYLPNGNVLILAWDARLKAEALESGRTECGDTLWSEKIIEVQPDFVNGGGTVVWEWKLWDHLVQDVDSTKDNYGIVEDNPQLININYYTNGALASDWHHMNSVDYNADLDQIVMSSHNFSEIYIIDHSTTTSEAASHIGGNSNKGGDILYRWGNPLAYNQGAVNDQLLFLQHDAYWIEDSLVDGGKIMVFNNKAGVTTNYSTVNIINPPVGAQGNYSYSGGAYEPSGFDWTYMADTPSDFYATNISGAQRLPDSTTIICQGPAGRLFEVDYDGNIVWEYVNPISNTGIATQNSPSGNNQVFRSPRYPRDYPGLVGHDLTPQGYIESGSTFVCELYTIGIEEIKYDFVVYPNPGNSFIRIKLDERISKADLKVFSVTGSFINEFDIQPLSVNEIDFSDLENGIYILRFYTDKGIFNHKLIMN